MNNRSSPAEFEYAMYTGDKVFAYESDTSVDTSCHPHDQCTYANMALDNFTSAKPTLYAAGAAVGRVFSVMNTLRRVPIPNTLQQLRVYTSTAFYVAPNTLCTSRHAVDIDLYIPLCTYFTPKWRFLSSNVEDLLYTLQFPLSLNQPEMDEFHKAMAKRGLYLVDKIIPLTDQHVRTFSHFRDPDPLPYRSFSSNIPMAIPNDFAFLHVTLSSPQWLVPSATTPINQVTCLIAYAGEPKQQNVIKMPGDEVRVTCFERIFGGYDVKFFAPGYIDSDCTKDKNGDVRLVSHQTSCEAASSGGPIIRLLEKGDYSNPTFVALHTWGYPDLKFSIAIPSTNKTFCMEWATHVLVDIQNAKLDDTDPRIPSLIEYLTFVCNNWPSDYEHEAIARSRSMLAQLQSIQK